ncbi:MAG TPA: ISAs1 family transposase [Methylocella sp.]|nr:ISAs1 family transposase [Methylocella sp.]
MCFRRSAAACRRFSDTRPHAGKGFEIPDALRLLERLDLKGKIVTGDAIFCQKSITAKIIERGGDYVFPVKDNQKSLKDDIETAFNAPVFPLSRWDNGVEKAHGRIERRTSDVLPAKAAGIEREWPTVRQICRVKRWRRQKVNGKWREPQEETVYLITSLSPAVSPQALLRLNRDHWGIEIMPRSKDVILGEDATRTAATTRPAIFSPSPASFSKF